MVILLFINLYSFKKTIIPKDYMHFYWEYECENKRKWAFFEKTPFFNDLLPVYHRKKLNFSNVLVLVLNFKHFYIIKMYGL